MSLVLCAAVLCEEAAWAGGAEGATKLGANTIAAFDVGASGAPLLLPVMLGDTNYTFLVDTGSIVCVLDGSFEECVEPAVCANVIDAPGPAPPLSRPPSMRLGAIDIGRPECALYPDFHKTFELNGLNIHGIIGMNVLRHLILHVDFDGGTLRILRDAGRAFGTAVPLRAQRGTFHVSANLAGEDMSFLVDTGNLSFYAGSLQKPSFDRLLAAGKLRLFTGRRDNSWTSDGVVPIRVAESDGLSLGPFSHNRLIVSDTTQDNKLGLGYFSRFEVIFDFPHSVMYLRPGKGFNRRDACALGGFGIAHIAGRILIVEIEPTGAARAAGLEQWDELLSVDDVSANDMALFDLQRLFSQAGQRKLKYRRGAEDREALIVLRDPRQNLVGTQPRTVESARTGR